MEQALPSSGEGVKLVTGTSDGLDYPTVNSVNLAFPVQVFPWEKNRMTNHSYIQTWNVMSKNFILFRIVRMAKYFVRNSCGCHIFISNLY